MGYWLTRYVGTGAEDDPFRPLGADELERWSAIDLRGTCTAVDGLALLHGDGTLPIRAGRVHLGDNPNEPSRANRKNISSRLGLSIATPHGLARIIRELLMNHGTPDGDKRRWNFLLPERHPEGHLYRIYLGGVIDELLYRGGPGAVFTDNFNVADADPLAGQLTWTTFAAPTWATLSNEASLSTNFGSDRFARADHDLNSIDHYAQAAWSGTSISTNRAGVCVRFDPSVQTCYFSDYFQDGSVQAVKKRVSAVTTSLASGAGSSLAGGNVLKLTVLGSLVTATRAGTDTQQVTDTSIVSGVRCGIFGRANGGDRTQLDSFECGDTDVARPTSRSTFVGASQAAHHAAGW